MGFVTTAELRASGHSVDRIRERISRGELERVIRGWYATPGTSRDAIRAMRVGGRLTCVSALQLAGAWCPPGEGLHIGFPSHASGRRRSERGMPPGAVAHWQPKAAATGSAFAVAPLELAVPDLLACQPQHHVVAVLDSLLHRRLIQRNRLDALLLAGPVRMRSLVDSLDARSEEGIESIVRFRLAAAGIRCRIQVVVRSGTRVDLLIDDWLVLEIDGKEIHAKEEAFTPDRVRAAWVMRHGRFVLRFAYATVIYDWDFVLDTVRDVIAQHAPIR